MPDSRLERTRKLYQELNVRLPDTTRPHWWTEEYEKALFLEVKVKADVVKSDPNA